MSTGKPILSTYASEQEPSIPYLREYAHSLLLAETDVIRKEDRERITAFLKKLPPDLDVQDLRDKYYRCTPAAFCDMLDNLGTRVGARGNSF